MICSTRTSGRRTKKRRDIACLYYQMYKRALVLFIVAEILLKVNEQSSMNAFSLRTSITYTSKLCRNITLKNRRFTPNYIVTKKNKLFAYKLVITMLMTICVSFAVVIYFIGTHLDDPHTTTDRLCCQVTSANINLKYAHIIVYNQMNINQRATLAVINITNTFVIGF